MPPTAVRSFKRLVLGVALAATAAGAALAQTEKRTGSHLDTPARARIPTGLSPADTARATLIAFGECVARTHRRQVEQALAMSPFDGRYKQAIINTATEDCLDDGELDFGTSLMRGSLFVALYRIDFRTAPGALAAQPLDIAADLKGSEAPEARAFLALHWFADCVVRAGPAAARALVLAPVAGRDETEAFASLAPHFSACIPQGQDVHFSKIVLTGLIAEALYREHGAAKP